MTLISNTLISNTPNPSKYSDGDAQFLQKEYALKNDNLQAKLEQIQQRFQDLQIFLSLLQSSLQEVHTKYQEGLKTQTWIGTDNLVFVELLEQNIYYVQGADSVYTKLYPLVQKLRQVIHDN